jgi:hypothetical protein
MTLDGMTSQLKYAIVSVENVIKFSDCAVL